MTKSGETRPQFAAPDPTLVAQNQKKWSDGISILAKISGRP
jgi:hypothetical protein